MRVCVDLRCLQKGSAAGLLARSLLVHARSCLGPALVLAGLTDESLPELPPDCAALLDEVRSQREAPPGPLVFLQPSLAEPDLTWLATLLHRPRMLSCACVEEGVTLGPAGRPNLPVLAWLRCCDILAASTESAARQVRELLGLGPERVRVTGNDPRQVWACVSSWRPRSLGRPSAAARPRLAILSPYPPDESGVADYTAACTRKLAVRAAIDVFTSGAPRRDPWVRKFYPLDDGPYLNGEYDRVLAVLANHPFHLPILELHTRHGGACLAHDNRLTELYAWARGPERVAELASVNLQRPVSLEEVQSWLLDTHDLHAPLFDEVASKADPFLVHSAAMRERLERQYGARAVRLPFCCLRTFSRDDLSPFSVRAARSRLKLDEDRILLISTGSVVPCKGPLDCIWAVEQLLAWGVPIDLHLVGAAPYLAEFLRLWVERLELQEHVRILNEWVSERTYRDYLLAADLAVQIKTPGFVGVSGAALDCISAGVPTVMNDALADALEAPGYVARVPDLYSPLLLAERLLGLIAHLPEHDRRCQERADYVAAHDFDRYAGELLRALEVA